MEQTDNSKLIEACWKQYSENYSHVRHHDVQRSSTSTVLIAISAAIIGVIAFDKSISVIDLPLCILLVLVGVFGIIFSLKHWERSSFHMQNAVQFKNKVAELIGDENIFSEIEKSASTKHNSNFPFLHKNVKIYQFWCFLYLIIALFGIVLSVISISSIICIPVINAT